MFNNKLYTALWARAYQPISLISICPLTEVKDHFFQLSSDIQSARRVPMPNFIYTRILILLPFFLYNRMHEHVGSRHQVLLTIII